MKSGKIVGDFREADTSRMGSQAGESYQEDANYSEGQELNHEYQAEPDETDDRYWDSDDKPEDPHAPQQENFETYDDWANANTQYQTAKAVHSQNQQAAAQQAQANIVQEAMARQGIGNFDDPLNDEKLEMGRWIRSLGERINEARAEGDHRKALELEMQLHRDWAKLEKMPASPAVRMAEEKNIDHLGTQWTAWMEKMKDPQFVNGLVSQYGHERVLKDVKTWMNQINRLHDGNTKFAILRGHSDRYGRPNEIKPGQMQVIDVLDKNVADSIRREIIAGFDPEEALLRAGMLPELSESELKTPKQLQQEKADQHLRNLDKMTEKEKKAYLDSIKQPIKPTRNPDNMTQAEYEAWRAKGGGK